MGLACYYKNMKTYNSIRTSEKERNRGQIRFEIILKPCLFFHHNVTNPRWPSRQGEGLIGKAVSEAPVRVGSWFSFFSCPSRISHGAVILAHSRSPGSGYRLSVLMRRTIDSYAMDRQWLSLLMAASNSSALLVPSLPRNWFSLR